MKIIKVLLIIFPLIFSLSLGSSIYFNNFSNIEKLKTEINVDIPKSCGDTCANLSSTEMEMYTIEFRKRCEDCKSTIMDEKVEYHLKFNASMFFLLVSGVVSFITLVLYFAIKFSVVRTTAAVSFIWLAVATVIAVQYNRDYALYILLYNSPVFLYWLYRFIRYGPSKMFKDK